jgi:hypothetical protein
MRLPASVFKRKKTASDRAGLWRAAKRNCTALSVLFTFWPPGPSDRMKCSSISLSSIDMEGVISIMA